MIEEFAVQWHKMREALERQQLRLREATHDITPAQADEYQARIGQVIEKLNELMKDHPAGSS